MQLLAWPKSGRQWVGSLSFGWNRATHQTQIITTTGQPLKHSLLTYWCTFNGVTTSGHLYCTQASHSITRCIHIVLQNYMGAKTMFKHIRWELSNQAAPSLKDKLEPLQKISRLLVCCHNDDLGRSQDICFIVIFFDHFILSQNAKMTCQCLFYLPCC